MKKWVKSEWLWLIASLLVMMVLFYSSSQTAKEQSLHGTLMNLLPNQPFREIVNAVDFHYAEQHVSYATSGYYGILEFFLRKFAHFTTFFFLGLFLLQGLMIMYKRNAWLLALMAWLAPTGYAGMDEFHQSITGGRTPLVQDVMLDSAGAMTGVLLILLIKGILLKKRK
ncbi:MAG: VanZ family protein [Streptococcaceae bacterium]|jgi:VanZ family protein|nr:VanZ family protein [Streptococcaceae bacterium]